MELDKVNYHSYGIIEGSVKYLNLLFLFEYFEISIFFFLEYCLQKLN